MEKESVQRKAGKGKSVEGSGPGSQPVLPPCQVCGSSATGYHYGANTCEACKAFFRRTLVKKDARFACICTEQDRKDVREGLQKTLCPACRYKRCVDIGMSRDAVKIGRYTLSWKTKNIKEVNRLESRKYREPFSQSNSPLSPPTSESSASPAVSAPDSPEPLPPRPSFSLQLPKMKKCTCAEACPVHSMFALTLPADREGDSASEDLSVGALEEMVQAMCTAQEKLSVRDTHEKMTQDMKKYYEEYELRKEVFGEMSDLSYDEFSEFYKETGIDIDNRIEILKEQVTNMEIKIMEIVGFAKGIPGFKQLPIKDQENLIKASRCESSILAYYKSFDHSLKVMTCSGTGKLFHIDELKKFAGAEFLDEKFKLTGKISDLKFSVEEEALLRGIVMTYTDRCELECPSRVQEIQYRLIQCLQYVIQKQYGSCSSRLARIFNLLTAMRNYTEWEAQILKEVVLAYPMTQDYAFVREFIL